jgi:hypothetical protein
VPWRPTDAAPCRSFRDSELKALLEMRGVHGAEMSWVRDGVEGDEVRRTHLVHTCFPPRHQPASHAPCRSMARRKARTDKVRATHEPADTWH